MRGGGRREPDYIKDLKLNEHTVKVGPRVT
jgi:hypothetical protein